jgi:unsaturated chondroitin disaccharide hydrolase
MHTWIDEAIAQITRKMPGSVAQARAQGLIPYKGIPGGWLGAPFDGNAWWTGGFWPGLLWQLFAETGDAAYREEALRVEALLVPELAQFEGLNHDVGFMYLPSCGMHHRLMGDTDARRHALHAANLLAGRFNPAGFIRAWNMDRTGWAIIDCMMNLTLLHWATRQTGDPRFAAIAGIHADTAIREFVRPNGSCNHIVIFDPLTGQVLEKPGGQGYRAGSSWSRGQAWGLYGFTLQCINTGTARYLETARRIADYFIAQIRPDGLTDCDFCQPEGVDLIDNIAAAIAACGLLELAQRVPDADAVRYHGAALRLLRALHEQCADYTDGTPGILQKCTASYHEDGAGRHENIVYGDYFYVEALRKLRGEDSNPWLI